MDCISWILDGIGTSIISGLFGLLVGGAAGYKIGVSKTIKQKQKAGNNSIQTQIGENNGSN